MYRCYGEDTTVIKGLVEAAEPEGQGSSLRMKHSGRRPTDKTATHRLELRCKAALAMVCFSLSFSQ